VKIILLASFPRSGNTFLRIGIEDVYGISTFSVYPEIRLEDGNLSELILHQGEPPNVTLAWNEAYSKRFRKPDIAFIKTHDVEDIDLPYPAVHIIRDGRDVLVSWAHFEKEIHKKEGSVLELMEYGIRNKVWSNFVKVWAKRPKIHTVSYEKLWKNPIREIMRVGDVAGLKRPLVRSVKLRTFEEFQDERPLDFRRGIIDSWKDEMPKDLQDLFWQYNGEAMELLGYK